jgi:hypothetical protein
MNESPEQAAEAAEKAEKAAERAEKAANRSTLTLAAGFLFALVGAVLAFALEDSDASVLGVSLQSLGGVLFAAGTLLVAGAAIGSMGKDGPGDSGSIKAISGLLAVLAAIVAVTALTIVTLATLGSGSKESTIAVTSSAFGIISAVVGAYLGIKITADTTAKASDSVKQAAVAKYKANVAQSQVTAWKAAVEENVGEDDARKIQAEADRKAEEVGRTAPPTEGGGDV